MTSQPFFILHVEDDANDVLLVERALRKINVPTRIFAVPDGDKAVSYLSGRDEFTDRDMHPLPALVLLDLKMPRKSGLEVLAWIRGQPGFRSMVVVIFTSSKHEHDMEQAYQLGANSYLVKPVGFESLAETVRALNHYWGTLNQSPGM